MGIVSEQSDSAAFIPSINRVVDSGSPAMTARYSSPPVSSDDSAFAEMCAQSVRGSPDDMIAFGMTVKIIHRFEFVDIDDDEGER